jgi:hypothetical protein
MNEAAAKLEKFYGTSSYPSSPLPSPFTFSRPPPTNEFSGRTFTRTHRSLEEINAALAAAEKDPWTDPLELAQIEQWEVSGATACPREKTLRQREKYFSSLQFVTIDEMLKMGKEMERV